MQLVLDLEEYVPICLKKIDQLNPSVVGHGNHSVPGNNGYGNGGDDGGWKDPGIR